MGSGGLREAGEEGAGGGISKRGGSREKWGREVYGRREKRGREGQDILRGREPGVMGAGGLREAGEEGAGGGIPKRGGSREKWVWELYGRREKRGREGRDT